MELPENLQNKYRPFPQRGRFVTPATELFKKPSWFAVFMGQFIEPTAYHPLVDSRPSVDAAGQFAATANWVDRLSTDARAWRLHRPQRRAPAEALKRPSGLARRAARS